MVRFTDLKFQRPGYHADSLLKSHEILSMHFHQNIACYESMNGIGAIKIKIYYTFMT